MGRVERVAVVDVHMTVTPPAILRERLAAARRIGVGFDEAWPAALAAAVSTARWEREEWIDALLGTIEAWRAAWEQRDASRAERSLLVLVTPGGTPLPERACEHCGKQIPTERGRHRQARFCSDRCRRRATYLRERAAA
jgi:predicted nucleic acid-binding Zn ribbon protein